MQIKFRGKSLSTGEWVYGYYVYCAREVTIDTPIMEHRIYTIGGSYFVVDPKTVGQYVGMNDAEKNEIYDGDVINYTYECCEDCPNYEHDTTIVSIDFAEGFFWTSPYHRVYIIGNIHDNPTLTYSINY